MQGIYAITPNQKLDINNIKQMLNKHKPGFLQYRHKTNDKELKITEAKKLKDLCLLHNTVFIINDDINLAQIVDADGVHLGKDDLSIKSARLAIGEGKIIGTSCYNDIDTAKNAQEQGANYVAFGALFSSSTKPNASHCSLDIISKAKQVINIPIVGIGGVDFNNMHQALNAGCDSVAMIKALYE